MKTAQTLSNAKVGDVRAGRTVPIALFFRRYEDYRDFKRSLLAKTQRSGPYEQSRARFTTEQWVRNGLCIRVVVVPGLEQMTLKIAGQYGGSEE